MRITKHEIGVHHLSIEEILTFIFVWFAFVCVMTILLQSFNHQEIGDYGEYILMMNLVASMTSWPFMLFAVIFGITDKSKEAQTWEEMVADHENKP